MLLDKLKQRFGDALLDARAQHGDETIVVARGHAARVLLALRDEPEFAFESLVDLTAVDWPERSPRFELVYHLKSLSLRHRLRLKVPVPGDDAWMPSAIEIWKSADWLERECYDMFGIDFRGHPDLRRILLYDQFEGHPLRKDYQYTRRQPLVPETDPVLRPWRHPR